MIQWEYACLSWQEVFVDGKWDHRDYYFRGPDGSIKQLQVTGVESLPILNDLGKDGWEVFQIDNINHVYYRQLVDGAYPTAQPILRMFWLKRPIK